jgi:DNA-binding HxlR family transcriptional regulator
MAIQNLTIQPHDTSTIESALKLLSPRWTVAVLIELGSGKKRTKELIKRLAPISAKTLIERLSTLRKYGLVERRVYREVPPRVEYELTEDGAELLELLTNIKSLSRKMPEDELHNWGNPSLR